MTSRQSRTLIQINGTICCADCEFEICKNNQLWKDFAAISVVKVKNIPGSTSSTHGEVEIRRFSCPKCAALLDTETALPDDPYLYDVIN